MLSIIRCAIQRLGPSLSPDSLVRWCVLGLGQENGHVSCAHRKEYIRLLEQALGSLGFHEAAAQLQKDSGVSLESLAVGQLRAAVQSGAYDEAVELIEQLPLSSPDDVLRAKFLVLQQKYLEVI